MRIFFNCVRIRRIVCNFLMAIIAFTSCTIAAEMSNTEIELLIRNLKEKEAELKVSEDAIVIDSKLQYQTKNTETGNWENTPLSVSAKSLISIQGCKCKIEVNKDVAEWKNGSAPYIDSSYSMYFNGKEGGIINHERKYNDKTIQENNGKISNKAPEKLKQWKIRALSGKAYTSYYFMGKQNLGSFSKFLEDTWTAKKQGQASYSFEKEKYLGIDSIKISSEDKSYGEEIFWLDPQRGYCLLGYKMTNILKNGKDWILENIDVQNLKEVLPGIWYPVEVIEEKGAPKEENSAIKVLYKAQISLIKETEELYNVSIPEGCNIKNEIVK